MLSLKKYGLLGLISLTFVWAVVAQETTITTAASKTARKINALETLYDETVDTNTHLYNGQEYIPYTENTEGYPYYLSEVAINGTITYSNQFYKRVALQYDLLYDQVVIEHPIYSNSVQLVAENIKDFSLGDKKFIHLVTDSAQATIPSGFYQLLYNGKSQCLAKRKKTIVQKVKSGELEVKFHESVKLFILKNNKYYLVNSKRDLKNIFTNETTSVNQIIRKNGLSFRLDKEDTMVKVAAFYDEMK